MTGPDYRDRMIVLRPEASDADLARLNVIHNDADRAAIMKAARHLPEAFGNERDRRGGRRRRRRRDRDRD